MGAPEMRELGVSSSMATARGMWQRRPSDQLAIQVAFTMK
jgi:hypothetical protein